MSATVNGDAVGVRSEEPLTDLLQVVADRAPQSTAFPSHQALQFHRRVQRY